MEVEAREKPFIRDITIRKKCIEGENDVENIGSERVKEYIMFSVWGINIIFLGSKESSQEYLKFEIMAWPKYGNPSLNKSVRDMTKYRHLTIKWGTK